MAFQTLNELLLTVRSPERPRKVAVPGAADEQTLMAVIKAYEQGIVLPILLGPADKLHLTLRALGYPELSEQVIHADTDAQAAAQAVRLCREGEAELLMRGAMDIRTFLCPVLHREGGLRRGSTRLSDIAFTEIPGYHKILAITDCGILVRPDLDTKRCIIENAVRTLGRLGYREDIKVAVIAGADKVSPLMPETEDALRLKEMNQAGELRGCIVDGPMSLDVAIIRGIAALKQYGGRVAGDADVLVLPDMTSANVLVKALKFAHAKSVSYAAGGIVPIALSSRGSPVENKYISLVFAATAATQTQFK